MVIKNPRLHLPRHRGQSLLPHLRRRDREARAVALPILRVKRAREQTLERGVSIVARGERKMPAENQQRSALLDVFLQQHPPAHAQRRGIDVGEQDDIVLRHHRGAAGETAERAAVLPVVEIARLH